jgi:ABC-type polysaccharide/polyol phosphate transport system ATPase subunit
MSSDVAEVAVAAHVTKTYRSGVGRARIREMLPWPVDRAVASALPRWWTRDTFNALEDVSVAIRAGSSVGLIGPNGAGKTTLLKLISGVTTPTTGTVATTGRMGALIDVLVGFHPDLTGRENIYLLGAIHGLGRRTVHRRIPDILDFAEISDLADTPLKRYSAGMGARLGFGTLTALDLDVLLIDEVLAVGDASFQRKCLGWLDSYTSKGGTLVIVSHNLAMVRNMTERALWLDHGKVYGDGPTREIVAEYARNAEYREDTSSTQKKGPLLKSLEARGINRWGAGGARVEHVIVGELDTDRSLRIAINYQGGGIDAGTFGVGFIDDAGRELGASMSEQVPFSPHAGLAECVFSPVPLHAGIYFPIIAIMSADGVVRDRWRLDRPIVIDAKDDGHRGEGLGPVALPASWSIK